MSEDKPVVCKRLHAKGAWVRYGEPVTWEAGYVSTAVFWCLETADALGPDDGFVHPHACVRGRSCFDHRSAVEATGHCEIVNSPGDIQK
jgi:hypothetical protein